MINRPAPLQQALVLQSAAAPIAPPEIGVLEQFGLVGVIGFLFVKEGLAWFRSKEDSESKLLETLVSDMRSTQQQLLERLFTLHSQQHQDLAELKEGLREVCDRLDKLI